MRPKDQGCGSFLRVLSTLRQGQRTVSRSSGAAPSHSRKAKPPAEKAPLRQLTTHTGTRTSAMEWFSMKQNVSTSTPKTRPAEGSIPENLPEAPAVSIRASPASPG